MSVPAAARPPVRCSGRRSVQTWYWKYCGRCTALGHLMSKSGLCADVGRVKLPVSGGVFHLGAQATGAVNHQPNASGAADVHGAVQGGFFMKAIVVAVSSFQNLLFLDADNVPAADPAVLFDSDEFAATGAMFWRDFWDASWAPDAPAVLRVRARDLPGHSHESGQMVLDKLRCGPMSRGGEGAPPPLWCRDTCM